MMAAPILTCVFMRKCNISWRISAYVVAKGRHMSIAPHVSKKHAKKQVKYLKKVADSFAEVKKRKKWYTNNLAPAVQTGAKKQSVSQGMMRRAKQLNVVFYESIYGSFYYEDICPELLKHGLEFSKVVISPDFNNLTVYWIASGDTSVDNNVATLLDSCKGKLRSSLMAKRVIGRVPPIHFVKDIKASQSQIVDKLLNEADMGEGYEPPELGYQLKSPPRTPFYAKSIEGDSVDNPPASYSYVDGPGAKLVVWNNADFGESSSNFTENRSPPEKESNSDILGIVLEQENRATSETEPISCEEAGILLRNDLYDLDHSNLLQHVTQIKNRFKDRSYEIEPEASRKKELSRLRSKELNSAGLDSARIHKLLKDSKKSRMQRPSSEVISSAVFWEDWQSEKTKVTSGDHSYEYDKEYLDDDFPQEDYDLNDDYNT